jgi:hypothetical protein
VYVRRVDSSPLVFSLSSHRHSSLYRLIINIPHTRSVFLGLTLFDL